MPAFTLHSDPGHAWLAVSVQDALALGLTPASFSRYSYRRFDTLYLEEDRDAGVFCDAYVARHGALPPFKEAHTDADSFVRRLARLPG